MSRINSKENATRSREGSKEASRKGSRGKSRERGRERGREEGISWAKNGSSFPENIFKRSSTSSSIPQGISTGPQSLNVRDAMVALRHAIRNPLSNQHEVTIRIRM